MKNKEKIEYLSNRYYKSMHNAAMIILGDYHLAEDACQDTFIKLIRNADILDDITSERVKNYCFVLLRHTATDIARKWHRQVPTEILYEDNVVPEVSDEYPYETEDMIKDIMSLPYHYRVVVTMRCLGKHSSRETAEYLGSNVSTVNARLSRAKKILHEKWNTVA